jgi:hypothetical protein
LGYRPAEQDHIHVFDSGRIGSCSGTAFDDKPTKWEAHFANRFCKITAINERTGLVTCIPFGMGTFSKTVFAVSYWTLRLNLTIRVNVTFEEQDRDNWKIGTLRRYIPVVPVQYTTIMTQYVDTQLFITDPRAATWFSCAKQTLLGRMYQIM